MCAKPFADGTALLEDLHGLMVEGQGTDVPPKCSKPSARDIRAGIRRLARLIVIIHCAASD
jgi:hypothetical protein